MKNKSFKINKRLFSANIKGLPKIRYTVNEILFGDFKRNNKRIGSLKTIEKIKALKSSKNDKDKKDIKSFTSTDTSAYLSRTSCDVRYVLNLFIIIFVLILFVNVVR